MPVANLQTDGTFSMTTFLEVKPSVGFKDYTICARMFLMHYRGTYNSVVAYGKGKIPDVIFIGNP